jgi:hypothetical protein
LGNKPGRQAGVALLVALLLLLLFAYLLVRFAPSENKPWEINELRALDPLDAPEPALDLIAVYTRNNGFEKQIRFDFLDLPEKPASDIYIALDTQPGGSKMVNLSRLDLQALYPEGLRPTDIAYDLLLVIPAEGEPGVIDLASSSLSNRINPRINRDPVLDTLTVRFNYFDLPTKYSLQVFVTSAGEHTLTDQSVAISSDSTVSNRAPVLMAFSQTFPATTAAQTLRRWDGAHTGPYGERHGLHSLIEAASVDHIPLALLDLKTPASLSALDLTGGVKEVRQMWRNRLLILPDVVYGEPSDKSLANSISAAESFGLPIGKFIYSPGTVVNGYALQFFNNPEAASPLSIKDWNGQKLLAIPPSKEEQTTPDGPTLEVKRSLITAALDDGARGMVILGGDLPVSTWGDSDAGPAGLRYIASHPWIQPLDADALLSLVPETTQTDPRPVQESPSEPIVIYNSQGQATNQDSTTLQKEILSRLESAPDNPLTDSAWEMYFLLTAPVRDPQLAALNAQYLGDINFLLTAADWGIAPASQSTCSVDLNFDLLPDCVLADDQFFAVFQSDGARLAYLFLHNKDGVHQIIAPGWQFTTGLSDRTQWQPSFGSAADPSQIPGAFFDTDSPWRANTPTLNTDGSVTFSSSGGQVKTYRLTKDGVLLEFHGAPLIMNAGLALDPWRRFEQGWGNKYHGSEDAGTLNWQLNGGPYVQMDVSNSSMDAFNDTLQYLSNLEDPNQDFPPGHFLPFPMAVMKFPVADGNAIQLKIK